MIKCTVIDETSFVLQHMQERLSAHGFCPEDVRHVNLVVSDMDMFNFVNAEYIKFFGMLVQQLRKT